MTTTDSTILAVLSRYPEMGAAEVDAYLGRIECPDARRVAQAVVGRATPDSLDRPQRATYDDFQRWAEDRTRRTRGEEISARQRQKETRTALGLARLRDRGLVTDRTLMLYGISGVLPEREIYEAMTPQARQRLWQERMERRFGPFVGVCPTVHQRDRVDWAAEGF